MGKRIQHRQGDGRWRQSTLADLGVRVAICPKCGAFNPYTLAEQTGPFVEPAAWNRPEKCEQCGEEFNDTSTGE